MKKLSKRVSKNGYVYKQTQRYDCPVSGRSVIIYSMHTNDDEEKLIAHETFIIPIRKKPITTPSGIIVPQGEKFPGNQEFGTTVKGSNCGGIDSQTQILEEFEKLKKYLQNGKSKFKTS